LDICSALVEGRITAKEFEDAFSTKDVLNYAIIACGGNPREFLILFERLIRNGIKNDVLKIGKTMIYSIVFDTIEEKENSIKDDEVLSKEKVLEAVGLIKEQIVTDKNTNVFLYPQELYEKHSFVLKSLISFGYVHQLKESIVSDYHGKKTFVPFCIDMSLYVTESSMKRKFDFKEFWVRDDKSRLINIVKAPQWNLPESFFNYA
jgi:hypothetical protein